MKTITSEKFLRVIKNKKKLEHILKVTISNRGKEITIEGEPAEEHVALQVIDALSFGFPFATAISIKEEDKVLEVINIKEHTNRKDFASIRARIIGKEGKVLRTLSNLTGCDLELRNNQVGIIGESILMKHAKEALISLIRGAKHGNVYTFLEKTPHLSDEDLGLKEKPKKKVKKGE
jgi:ribosomal RNA assembly protein